MIVDTHCHLDFDQFDEDREAVIERALAAGVERIIIPAVDLETIPRILALTEAYPPLYAAVGVHPNSTADLPADWLIQLEDYGEHEKVVAIGEIGLDYYWDRSPRETQHRTFAEQLELAFELALPVIIHNRDASGDILKILGESSLKEVESPGVLHSFLSDRSTALAALEMGYFLGFTGPLTYKKNEALRQIVREIPLDRIVIETDAPYLTPQAHRGTRNEPAFVGLIAAFLADLRGISPEMMGNITSENAAFLFGRDAIFGT